MTAKRTAKTTMKASMVATFTARPPPSIDTSGNTTIPSAYMDTCPDTPKRVPKPPLHVLRFWRDFLYTRKATSGRNTTMTTKRPMNDGMMPKNDRQLQKTSSPISTRKMVCASPLWVRHWYEHDGMNSVG